MAFRDRNDNDSLENKGRFNIFSWMTRDGAGVEPGEEPVMKNPSVKNFFKLFGRKFNQIITLNLMMIAGNFPIFFLFAMMTGYFSINTASPAYTLFAQLNGALGSTPSAYSAALFGSYSIQTPLTVLSTVDYVLIALSCLVLFTFGPVMVGSSYIMRNMVRQEPIFMKHDFFYAIKRQNYSDREIDGKQPEIEQYCRKSSDKSTSVAFYSEYRKYQCILQKLKY